MKPEFTPFPKMARLNRECIITEKIDGTNACIQITDDGLFLTGSRTRWITPDADNFGFSAWAHANKEELMQLGPGRHFGEWWGSGIQRGYGLSKGEKRFSLFNTVRWCAHDAIPRKIESVDPRITKYQDIAPACCFVVPEIYKGPFNTDVVQSAKDHLAIAGSCAVAGFMKPEGIVIFHTAANLAFKVTLEKDEQPKSFNHETISTPPRLHGS